MRCVNLHDIADMFWPGLVKFSLPDWSTNRASITLTKACEGATTWAARICIFLPTAGLIEAMGPLVSRFTKTKDSVIHASIIEEANALAPKVELKDKENIQSYIKFMQRISERGFPWIKTEILRLEDLITGEKISKHNQILLQRKVNILHIFDRDYVHDEL